MLIPTQSDLTFLPGVPVHELRCKGGQADGDVCFGGEPCAEIRMGSRITRSIAVLLWCGAQKYWQ